MSIFETETIIKIIILFFALVFWRYLYKQERILRKIDKDNKRKAENDNLLTKNFGDRPHVMGVFNDVNFEFYHTLLVQFEDLILAEGFKLSSDGRNKIILKDCTMKRIAKLLFVKREQYLAPYQSMQDFEDKANLAIRDGFALKFLEYVISANERLGYYITSDNITSHADTASYRNGKVLPFRQMKITIRATKVMLTRDIVRCLHNIASHIRETTFAKTTTRSTEEVDDGIVYELESWLNPTLPGFFPAPAGNDVPQCLEREYFHTVRADSCRQYIFLLQGTQITSPEGMALHLVAAAKRIEVGESTGADYDDDYGYAFKVFQPL